MCLCMLVNELLNKLWRKFEVVVAGRNRCVRCSVFGVTGSGGGAFSFLFFI